MKGCLKFIIFLIVFVVAIYFSYKCGEKKYFSKKEPPPKEVKPEKPAVPKAPETKSEIEKLKEKIEEGNFKPIDLYNLALYYIKKLKISKAIEYLRKIPEKFPKSEIAALAYYKLAELSNDPDQKIKYFEKIIKDYPESKNAPLASEALGNCYFECGEKSPSQREKFYTKARNALSFAYLNMEPSDKRSSIKKRLDELNDYLIFSPRPTEDSEKYTVKKGDSLTKIARKFNCPKEFIQRINKLKNPNELDVNQGLKVLDMREDRFKILVKKSEFRLIVIFNDHYLKEYPCGLGKSGKTPCGKFKIAVKQEKPSWKGYLYGDKRNILGSRWLGFENTPSHKGFGIHGCSGEASSFKKGEVSQGCVRMRNSDVEELFDMTPKGTIVTIIE